MTKEHSNELTKQEMDHRLEVFKQLWELNDKLKITRTELLNAAKIVNQVNAYQEKVIQIFYEGIRQKARAEKINPQGTIFYKMYEEMEINNSIEGRYSVDLIRLSEEMGELLEQLETIANEV